MSKGQVLDTVWAIKAPFKKGVLYGIGATREEAWTMVLVE